MPKEAIKHEYLLAALFSFTSLHIASTTGSALLKKRYISAAVEYHSSSLRLYMEELRAVTANNCQAIYICSLAHFALGITLPQMAPMQGEYETIKQSIFSALALFQGSKEVLRMFQPELSTRPITVVLAPKDMSVYTHHDLDFCQALDRLRILNGAYYPSEESHTYLSNQHAIQELAHSSTRLTNGVEAALTGWLMSLDGYFVTALHEQQVIPTLVLMHWAILLDRPNKLWWVFRSAQSLVSQLVEGLSQPSEREQEAIDYCLAKLGVGSE